MSSSASLHVVRRPPPPLLRDTMTSESAADKGLCDKSITLRKHRKNVFNKTGESLPFVRFCLFCIYLCFVFSRFSLRLLVLMGPGPLMSFVASVQRCVSARQLSSSMRCHFVLPKKTYCHFTYCVSVPVLVAPHWHTKTVCYSSYYIIHQMPDR